MIPRDRRFGVRVPFELLLDHYVNERRFRALTGNLSETGVYLSIPKSSAMPRAGESVTLDFQLPGTDESIWVAGVIRYLDRGDELVAGVGIRFTAMARRDARALRDFCVEHRRQRLSGLLAGLTSAVRSPARTALAAA